MPTRDLAFKANFRKMKITQQKVPLTRIILLVILLVCIFLLLVHWEKAEHFFRMLFNSHK